MMKKCDVFIAGGGVGGVAAALRAAEMGCSVVLTDENVWLGGQITAQGVSALDEHKMMETFGGTALYYEFRERIRQYYRRNYILSSQAKQADFFNPGCSSRQRRLAFEPIAGKKVIDEMLAPAVKAGRVTVCQPAKVIKIDKDHGRIIGATMEDLKSGKKTQVEAAVYIDATELGDLLPLAGIPYRTGVESYAQTHEPSAPEISMPDACQAFNYTFALEKKPGTTNVITKPKLYDEMSKSHRFSLNNMKMYDDEQKAFSFWTYRRIIDAANFNDRSMRHDITLVNCLCTDYKEDSIIDKDSAAAERHLYRAKQLALSYVYWLQTQAPRDDGGNGYPELKLRPDLMGTKDGLAQHPYIRESRRIISRCTVKEDDISVNFSHSGSRARLFHDAVGIGWYNAIDIHYCCHTKRRHGSGQTLMPFQIPMGAMLTGAVSNFIAGAKNIGTTHITNGVFRLHPVEWNIGESAGALAAYAVNAKCTPRQIYDDRQALRRFQYELIRRGVPLYWFDDVPLGHDAFIPVQYLALEGMRLASPSDLHFLPDQPISKVTGFQWICRAKHRYILNKGVVSKLQQKIHGASRAEFAKHLFKVIKPLSMCEDMRV